jgi:hypothetical protein
MEYQDSIRTSLIFGPNQFFTKIEHDRGTGAITYLAEEIPLIVQSEDYVDEEGNTLYGRNITKMTAYSNNQIILQEHGCLKPTFHRIQLNIKKRKSEKEEEQPNKQPKKQEDTWAKYTPEYIEALIKRNEYAFQPELKQEQILQYMRKTIQQAIEETAGPNDSISMGHIIHVPLSGYREWRIRQGMEDNYECCVNVEEEHWKIIEKELKQHDLRVEYEKINFDPEENDEYFWSFQIYAIKKQES